LDIERVLLDLPGVRDVCVVAAPSTELGEEVAAFLVADATVTVDIAASHCRGRLAPYKIPSIVRFIAEIPRNSGGKVIKADLLRCLTQPETA
jgi:long-chain acyl-CoA synthetase